MSRDPLDLDPSEGLLWQIHEGGVAEARAWSELQNHALDIVKALLTEIHRLRAEQSKTPGARIIETADELQDLPEEAVIIGREGWVWERSGDLWYTTASERPMSYSDRRCCLPARVIWMPEGGACR